MVTKWSARSLTEMGIVDSVPPIRRPGRGLSRDIRALLERLEGLQDGQIAEFALPEGSSVRCAVGKLPSIRKRGYKLAGRTVEGKPRIYIWRAGILV